MRNCSCYEDLEVKKRNTELNDSFLHATAPNDREEDPREIVNENDGIENAGHERKWEPKTDPIRNMSGSARPKSSMDDIQYTLQRLKEMRDKGLIDEDE